MTPVEKYQIVIRIFCKVSAMQIVECPYRESWKRFFIGFVLLDFYSFLVYTACYYENDIKFILETIAVLSLSVPVRQKLMIILFTIKEL